ncbi:hypothetical protein BKA62DRAFT_78802 [Auriculariales sp. MPI-PUGE-AT-0066]|nr:hypothetical protein BKA62DRAFT_78802 [Auriculariales sp. MPI-PUGE-AT-0066]
MFTVLALFTASALAATLPIKRQTTAECLLNAMTITSFRTVDSGVSHSVSFSLSVDNNAPDGYALSAACSLTASTPEELKATTGECDTSGSAFFHYNPFGGVLSVAIDYLCPTNEGTPHIVVFNGTVPVDCASDKTCSQSVEAQLTVLQSDPRN